MLQCHTGRPAITVIIFNDVELVCCNEVEGLPQELGCTHNPEEWRLFIDSPTFSLKAVLLHNTNINPSIPIPHFVHMKETYENVDLLFKSYTLLEIWMENMCRH